MPLLRVASRIAAAVILIGCGTSDQPAADSAATVGTPESGTTASTSGGTMASAPIVLSEVAGNWKFRATPTSGTDTTVTEYTLSATNTTEGWKITYSNGQVVPVKVVASGDSLITTAGPFKSVRRKGVDVTTNGVFRRDGDRLVGTSVAHYKQSGADSVLTLRVEGTRAP